MTSEERLREMMNRLQVEMKDGYLRCNVNRERADMLAAGIRDFMSTKDIIKELMTWHRTESANLRDEASILQGKLEIAEHELTAIKENMKGEMLKMVPEEAGFAYQMKGSGEKVYRDFNRGHNAYRAEMIRRIEGSFKVKLKINKIERGKPSVCDEM